MKRMIKWTRLGAVSVFVLVLSACGGGSTDSGSANTGEISGTIDIEAHTRVDADTADQADAGNFVTLNNDPSHIQKLPSPVILAGYMSDSSGTYPAIQVGSNNKYTVFAYPQDDRDLYQLNLDPNQKVVWQVFKTRADSSQNGTLQATIKLEDSSGTALVTQTTNGSSAVTMQLPSGASSGTYRLDLTITSGGPIRYVLSVSSTGSTAALPLTWSHDNFLPDQALVKMTGTTQGQASIQSAYNNLDVASATSLGNGMLRVDRVPQDIAQPLSAANRKQRLAETINWIRQLRKSGKVAVAEPNYLFRAYATDTPENQPYYTYQWNMPMINMPNAWQLEPNAGQGVTVAVLDTGIYRSISGGVAGDWHPDLNANVSSSGYDFVSGSLDVDDQVPNLAFGPSGPDNDPADPGDDRGNGSSFHGTHVAGIIAAAVNGIGVTGVAYDATILPVRVLGKGGEGSAQDIINAINWVDNNGHPRAQVINMSLGGLSDSSLLEDAVNKAASDGIVIVAAAGNDGTDVKSYPAALNNVIAVGAVDGGKNLASYSNYGSWVDLVAPGGDPTRDANGDGRADYIVSTWADDSSGTAVPGYAGMAGTSMAAPHVAGVIALMDAANPGNPVTYNTFEQALQAGDLTDDLGPPGRDNTYGYGLIDAVKAITTAANPGTLPTILSPSPTVISFSGVTTSESLTLKQLGSTSIGTVQVTIPTSAQSWLHVSSSSFDLTNDGDSKTLTVSINTANLPSTTQSFQSELDFQYQSKTLTVPVMVSLPDDAAQRNAGTLFVLLTQKDQNNNTKVVKQETVQAVNGQYQFDFKNLAPGQYEIKAGTDLDDDGYICTSGEACAEYPALGSLQPITVTSNSAVTGLTMTASYTRPVAASQSLPRPGFDGYQRNQLQSGSAGGNGFAQRQDGSSNAGP